MLDPVYAIVLTSLALALLAVMLLPAPSRPPAAEAGIQLALLSLGCLTVIVMGAFALTHHHEESTICGAIAWLLVMPCVWLSRAPRPVRRMGGGRGRRRRRIALTAVALRSPGSGRPAPRPAAADDAAAHAPLSRRSPPLHRRSPSWRPR